MIVKGVKFIMKTKFKKNTVCLYIGSYSDDLEFGLVAEYDMYYMRIKWNNEWADTVTDIRGYKIKRIHNKYYCLKTDNDNCHYYFFDNFKNIKTYQILFGV